MRACCIKCYKKTRYQVSLALSGATRDLLSNKVANMTILGTLLHLSNFKNPFLRTLVPSIGLAYGIQAAVAIPSILAQSERFYDLSGSVTYISCAALSLFMPAIRARAAARLSGAPLPAFPSLLSAFNGTAGPYGFNWRQVVLTTAVTLWATRCKYHRSK